MNKDGTGKPGANTTKSQKAVAREERLKEALRSNLRRRKGQSKARKSSDNSDK